jgi:hypothetical protein
MAKKKSKTSKTHKAAPLHLPTASASRRLAVMRDLNKVLLSHGVTGKVSEFHLSVAAGAVAAGAAAGCPPGQSPMVVCRKQPDGSVVCKEECR